MLLMLLTTLELYAFIITSFSGLEPNFKVTHTRLGMGNWKLYFLGKFFSIKFWFEGAGRVALER